VHLQLELFTSLVIWTVDHPKVNQLNSGPLRRAVRQGPWEPWPRKTNPTWLPGPVMRSPQQQCDIATCGLCRVSFEDDVTGHMRDFFLSTTSSESEANLEKLFPGTRAITTRPPPSSACSSPAALNSLIKQNNSLPCVASPNESASAHAFQH